MLKKFLGGDWPSKSGGEKTEMKPGKTNNKQIFSGEYWR
jgi:hypothetical protein